MNNNNNRFMGNNNNPRKRKRNQRNGPRQASSNDQMQIVPLNRMVVVTSHAFPLRSSGAVVSDSSGVIQLTQSSDPSSCNDWSHFSSLFDSYRVDSMSFEFVPKPTYANLAYGPVFMFFDTDTASFPSGVTTVDHVLEYPNSKIVDISKAWKVEQKLPSPTSIAAIAGSYTLLSGGYQDIATPAAWCALCGYGNGFTTSTTFGTYILTWNCVFKSKR